MPDATTELYKRVQDLERRLSAQESKAKADGWQLTSIFNSHRFGGGALMWQFDGHTRQIGGASAGDDWNRNAMADINYAAATYGGPYVDLDGAAEYLSHGNQSWQESLAEEFLVWGWCYPTDLSAAATVAAKFDTLGGAWRSWRLWYQLGTADFTFSISATGAPASAVDADSTYGSVAIDSWYFVAGYFEPSTTLNVYVGANTDVALTVDKVVVAVPASAFDGDADLTIGAQGNPSIYWPGRIGTVGGRANVPSADIDDHVNMLFQMTKERYEE